MINDNSFLRYEFKYFINSKISNEIFNQSLNFMKIDNFALNNKDKRYLVRSLYFDNGQYHNFFEKVDGIKIRKKFRLRSYDKNSDSKNPVFLEMKGRAQDRIIKKRVMIDKNDIKYFETLKNLDELNNKYKNTNLIKEFIYDVKKKNIKPKILIDYNRRPLINKFGLYFRLTFDSDLVTSKTSYLFENKKRFRFPLQYKPGNSILEVKFERSIPAWFHRIIQSNDLNRRSISKFVLGVCNCNIRNETSD
jgi:hypothetical protein